VFGAAKLAARKGQAIIIPTDNLLASAISAVAKVAQKDKILLVASDTTLVNDGATMAMGVNYFQAGESVAKDCAMEKLKNAEYLWKEQILLPTKYEAEFNKEALKALGLNPASFP